MALTNKLSAIGNAIRLKTGTDARFTLDDMPSAISSIITNPYGEPFEFGGYNAELVDEYSERFTLAETTFPIGTFSSTTATSIKPTVANRYTSPTITIGDRDVIVAQTVLVRPTYNSSITLKSFELGYAQMYLTWMSKGFQRGGTLLRRSSTQSFSLIDYYSAGGVRTLSNAAYGMYGTIQSASVASSTANATTVRASSPILYARVSTSYSTAANMQAITDCTWEWNVKAYLVDNTNMSTIQQLLINLLDS